MPALALEEAVNYPKTSKKKMSFEMGILWFREREREKREERIKLGTKLSFEDQIVYFKMFWT